MIINTKGVELSEKAYIKKAGTYLLKITKFETDGYTNEGNEKFKLHFEGNEIITKEGKPALDDAIVMHNELYSLNENMLWKIKTLEVAIKAPECYNIEDFVGRFVIATVSMREHNGKQYADVKTWAYSKQNDSLPPIPEATIGQEPIVNNIPVIDIDEDEIPF